VLVPLPALVLVLVRGSRAVQRTTLQVLQVLRSGPAIAIADQYAKRYVLEWVGHAGVVNFTHTLKAALLGK
jgi:hypothetical protein